MEDEDGISEGCLLIWPIESAPVARVGPKDGAQAEPELVDDIVQEFFQSDGAGYGCGSTLI